MRWDTGHEGVGQRLYNASRNAATLDAVLDNAKTKRYAYARLRRMVLWAYLGLTPAKLPASVPYLRILAANETGRALLGRMRKTARLPVITKPAATGPSPLTPIVSLRPRAGPPTCTLWRIRS